jgi:glucose-1-phosphate adenylyltransferase
MIMAGGRGERLFPLTRDVAKPAVTFGGSYKVIDFTLSNCFNSGFRQIYLLTQYSNVTMNRHIRLGWDSLFRGELNEYIEALPPQHRSQEDWYHGTADSLFQNIEIFEEHRPDFVLVLSGDHVYKMDYQRLLEYHTQRGAELTIGAVESDPITARDMGVMAVDPDLRVQAFWEKPSNPPTVPGRPDVCLISMGIYVFSTAKLVRELIRDAKNRNSKHDFGRNVIPAMIENKDHVFAYPFVDEASGTPSYWRDIGTLDSYYESNLDLVHAEPQIDLYDGRWPIRTQMSPRPPARIVDSTLDRSLVGTAIDSLISAGCIISGSRVERSVLSPEVTVHTGAQVFESILMDGVDVGRRSVVHRAIVCPQVKIPPDVKIGVDADVDRTRFIVTPDGVTVIPRGYTWI